LNILYSIFVRLLIRTSSIFAVFLDTFFSKQQSEEFSQNPILSWVKSLGAIHNIERLVCLNVPWWPYKATLEIEKFAQGRAIRVFEWGSGASTIWMLKRGFSVVSVEHDLEYSEKVKLVAKKENQFVNLIVQVPILNESEKKWSQKRGYENLDFTGYVNAIENFGEFDLIVIDGRAREACLKISKRHLSRGGIILFDNSNRNRYRSAIESDFVERKLRGMTPASPFPTQSSLLTPRLR
jgi:hypothetical protein